MAGDVDGTDLQKSTVRKCDLDLGEHAHHDWPF